MGVVLPISSPVASGWELADFLDVQQSSQAAAGGIIRVELNQLDAAELWLIDHMVVWCDSTTKTALRLYDSAPDPLRLLDGSAAGNFDVADWPNGLQVRSSSSLVALWTGASDGARAVLTVQGRIMRRMT